MIDYCRSASAGPCPVTQTAALSARCGSPKQAGILSILTNKVVERHLRHSGMESEWMDGWMETFSRVISRVLSSGGPVSTLESVPAARETWRRFPLTLFLPRTANCGGRGSILPTPSFSSQTNERRCSINQNELKIHHHMTSLGERTLAGDPDTSPRFREQTTSLRVKSKMTEAHCCTGA